MDKVIVMRWWQVPREEIPAEPGGADRVALRLVGADRRLDSGEPAAGSLPRPVPAYVPWRPARAVRAWPTACRPTPRRTSTSTTSAGSSGVVTGCGSSAASARASSGPAPPSSSASARRRRRPRRRRRSGCPRTSGSAAAAGCTTTASCPARRATPASWPRTEQRGDAGDDQELAEACASSSARP